MKGGTVNVEDGKSAYGEGLDGAIGVDKAEYGVEMVDGVLIRRFPEADTLSSVRCEVTG